MTLDALHLQPFSTLCPAQEILLTKRLDVNCVEMIVNFIRPSELTIKEINQCMGFAFADQTCFSGSKKLLERCKLIRSIIKESLQSPAHYLHRVLKHGLTCNLARIYYIDESFGIEPPYIAIAEVIEDIVRLAPQNLHHFDNYGDLNLTPLTIACLNKQVPIKVVEFLFKQDLGSDYKTKVSSHLANVFLAIPARDNRAEETHPARITAKFWEWPEGRFSAIQNLLKANGFPEVKFLLKPY